jgi:membrane protein
VTTIGQGAERLRVAARRGGRHAAKTAERALVDFFEDRCPQLAAAISYYTLFAIFPLTILTVGVFGLVVGEGQARSDVIEFLTGRLPVTDDAGRQDSETLLRDVTESGGAFQLVGAVGLLVSATALMAAVRNGLNTAWDVEERRPLLRGKAIDLLLVAGFGLLIAVSFALTVGRRWLADLGEAIGAPVAGSLSLLAGTGAWAIPLVISLAIFTLLYRFIPACRVRWVDAITGGAVAMLGYELAAAAFGYYLGNLADYGAVYGSLGAIVAFVFFIFLAANIFLLGAEIAVERPRVIAGRYYGGPPDERSRSARIRDALRGLVVH